MKKTLISTSALIAALSAPSVFAEETADLIIQHTVEGECSIAAPEMANVGEEIRIYMRSNAGVTPKWKIDSTNGDMVDHLYFVDHEIGEWSDMEEEANGYSATFVTALKDNGSPLAAGTYTQAVLLVGDCLGDD